MAYTAAAIARRRCTGTRKDGQPCKAWACWSDKQQRCTAHAGRHHTGPLPRPDDRLPRSPTMATLCRCAAYQWPHRPGSGLCCWPDPPKYTDPTPPNTHSERYMRLRRLRGRR